MKPFKNTNNPKSTAKPLQGTAASFAVKTNGGAAAFKNTRNSEKPNHGKLRKAIKSSATAPAGGGSFGKFIA